MISVTLLNWILAFLPVLIILLLMTITKLGGSKAGVVTFFATIFISLVFFGVTLRILAYSVLKSIILSVDVLLIIWGALFLYQITKEAGTIQIIGKFFQRLSGDKAKTGIFLGWLFPSFLQGMGGFGVPVAVTAPLLVSAGFSPELAVVITSIGHGWGVTFGSMGSSIRTTFAVTDVPIHLFGPLSAILLGVVAIVSGILVTLLATGKENLQKSLPLTLICGGILAGGQYLLSLTDYWIIAVTLPALAALTAAFFFTIIGSRESRQFLKAMNRIDKRQLQDALIPYGILVGMIFIANFSTRLRAIFTPLDIVFYFPVLSTKFGVVTNAGPSRTINPILHPGMIIMTSGLLSFLFFRKKQYMKSGSLRSIYINTVQSSYKTSIAIFSLVGSAVIMNYAGMTELLANGISQFVPISLYPVISPFIGGLGAFITGSNNNSNVLFASLQMQTAQMIGLPVGLILAAQTAGGALGSIMAPAKVILGCSTVGLSGKEGIVIRRLLIYGLSLILLIGICTIIIFRSTLLT